MTKTWEIPQGGGMHVVQVERTENGRDVVRVDGRVAAKPMAPDETERVVKVGSSTYLLERIDGDQFELTLQWVEPRVAQVASDAGRIGGLQSAAELLKQTRLLWLAIIGIVAVLLWLALGPNYEKQAAKRVELLLSEMSLGPGPQEDLAIGIWARNARVLDSQELGWAVGHFPTFRQQKDLRRKFTSWKVLDSEDLEGAKVPTAIVTIEVEGRRLKMRVPERLPISWEE